MVSRCRCEHHTLAASALLAIFLAFPSTVASLYLININNDSAGLWVLVSFSGILWIFVWCAIQCLRTKSRDVEGEEDEAQLEHVLLVDSTQAGG